MVVGYTWQHGSLWSEKQAATLVWSCLIWSSTCSLWEDESELDCQTPFYPNAGRTSLGEDPRFPWSLCNSSQRSGPSQATLRASLPYMSMICLLPELLKCDAVDARPTQVFCTYLLNSCDHYLPLSSWITRGTHWRPFQEPKKK